MSTTLAAAARHEIEVRRSRFIACVEPVPDRPRAQAVVHALWQSHPGATHVCWALMAGGHSAAVDDGEPGGTAGRPMLEVLRHHGLDGVLATVVRYYGGIKLGAGGLVRAYTEVVAQALLKAERVPVVRELELGCRVPYALEGALRRALARHAARLLEVRHEDRVLFRFALDETQAARLIPELEDGARGALEWL